MGVGHPYYQNNEPYHKKSKTFRVCVGYRERKINRNGHKKSFAKKRKGLPLF